MNLYKKVLTSKWNQCLATI